MKDLYSCSGSTVKIIRQCFHIDLDISPSKAAFKTGDHVGVWPENSSEEVVRLARAVNLFNELDNVIELVANPENKNSSTIKLPFSVPCTYRTALTYYVDLSSVLKQYHFEIFAKYANDDEEREILIKLSKDRELFVAAIEKPLKSLAETLEEFKSIELPISVVLSEILTRIQLRYYSISSSSLKDPTKVGITAVVVRFAIENPKIKSIVKGIKEKVEVIVKQGLTTSYFQRLYNSRSPQQLADSANLDSAESIPKFHLPMCI